MLALSIFIFLGLSLAAVFIELKYEQARWRLVSYGVLMFAALLVVALHYQRISPLAVVSRLEVQGQYYATDATIRISGDPAVADYYASSLLRRDADGIVKENPSIEISGYNDAEASLQAVTRGMARPLRHNGKIVNMRVISPGDEIRVGLFVMKYENGLFSRSQFVVGGQGYTFSWPDGGAAAAVGEILCAKGLSHAQQVTAFAGSAAPGAAAGPPENPLAHLWVVRADWQHIGIVNGSNETVTVNGEALSPEAKFVIHKGDQLVYGGGRFKTQLTVDLDPAVNRIYVVPEEPVSYALYRPQDAGSGDAEVFISSAPTITSPAYHLQLGERNRDLIKGSIKYKFDAGAVKEFVINNGMELRQFKAGEVAALGTSGGGALLQLTDDKMASWRPLLYVGVAWLVTGVIFFLLGGVGNRNYLFVLLPLVQLLLGIRLLLSYRGYVLPPFYQESYEKALFALIFVPYAIFLWLHMRELSAPFDMSGYVVSGRRILGQAGWNIVRALFAQPPFMYLLFCCGMLWLVGIGTAYRFILFIAFFVATALIAWFLSSMRNWGQSKDPILSWLSNEQHWDIWLLYLIPLGLPAVMRLTGLGTEEIPFTGLRAEVVYVPCLLFGTTRFFMWFFQRHFALASAKPGLLAFLWLGLPFLIYVVQAWLVGDWGSLIYSTPTLLLAGVVAWKANPRVTAGLLAAAAALIALFFWTPMFTHAVPAILPGESNVEYRFLAYENPGWLQEAALEASDEGEEPGLWQRAWGALGIASRHPAACREAGSDAARRVLGIHEHFWTMYHFAARDATGVGYGEAPIERVPFADGIAQSDNVYSIYLLSEHGAWGGVAVVSVYLLLALLLIFILTQHFGNELEPTLAVGGVAILLLFAALYHAGGNVDGVPFTGKNLPLLSLNSTADILMWGLLIAAALSIVGNGRDEDLPASGRNPVLAFLGSGNLLNRWLLLIGLLFAALFFPAVCFWTVRAAGDERYRSDYNLEALVEKTKQYINDGIIKLDPRRPAINIMTDQAKGLAAGQYLRLLRDQFNRATPEEQRSGKYFFVLNEQVLDEDVYGPEEQGDRYSERVLTIDQNYFKHPSPFSEKVNWRGALRSSDASEGEQGYLVGEGINLYMRHVLDSDDPIPGVNSEKVAEIANPGRPDFPGKFFMGRRFKVMNRAGKHIFDIYAIEADTVLEPRAEFTYVNGQEVRDKLRLEPGDIIAIKGSPQTGNRNLTFVFHREPAGTLAKSHWNNGRVAFTFPQGEAFAMARPIAEAVNQQVGQIAQKGDRDDAQAASTLPLTLSLDSGLNRRIYETLVEEAEGSTASGKGRVGLWQEVSNRRGLPPRLSVTAMNPQTGELLALASWPSFDPNPQPPLQERISPRSYTNLLRGRGPESRRFLLNHNFTRHVIGSATKPFIAAAAASAFPELLSLMVEDNAEEYKQVLGIPTAPGWQGGAQGEVDWNIFLSKSNNLYAVTLGFMGLTNSQDGRLHFSRIPTSQYYRLDMQRSNLQPDFTDIFKREDGSALKLEHTHLARWLSEIFGVRVSGPDAGPVSDVWRYAQEQSLLPRQGAGLSFISPELPNLALNNVRSARQVVGVFLGGNTNLWTNIKSAEAFSRIVTGRRVEATMVKLPSAVEFDKSPPAFEVVRPRLMDALEGVALGGGTASALAGPAAAINARYTGDERFTIFAKTGTLEGQYRSGRNDSNIIFAAGLYDRRTRTLRDAVVVSIFIEKGNKKGDSGRATEFAARLLRVLNEHYRWNETALK